MNSSLNFQAEIKSQVKIKLISKNKNYLSWNLSKADKSVCVYYMAA